MEMKLPQVERIVTETIDGKKVQKQIYADGSYGVRDGDNVTRYFPDGKEQTYFLESAYSFRLSRELLPDGTWRCWHENGQMKEELLSNGTRRWWYENGQMESEQLPDGTTSSYDSKGKMIYHATKGVEDTDLYVAKKRVAERRMKKEDKLSKGKDERVILPKMSKLSKAIEMKKAIKEVKKKRAADAYFENLFSGL